MFFDMNSFKSVLQQQFEMHPSMKTQDFIKLAFQAVYGPLHLINDNVKEYFYNEFNNLEINDKDFPLYEIISESFCRINFQAWKKENFNSEFLLNMFLTSLTESFLFLKNKNDEKEKQILNYLEDFCEFISTNPSFIDVNWKEIIDKYKINIQPIHHSNQYREIEKPAYRLVNNYFIPLLPIVEKVSNYFSKNDKPFVIAIDGRAASGKTTLAKILEKIFDGFVIHMDDFFLPLDLRTEKRFSLPGGNIHYERFNEEVIPFLKTGNKFSFRKFDCSKMNYNGYIEVLPKKIIIVEGSYSCHQEFSHYADLSIFLSIDSETQVQRIKDRNGEKMLERFKQTWIPMEEKYFENLEKLGKTWTLKL